MKKKSSDVFDLIKDEEAQYVDLRFSDSRGKLQHLSIDADQVTEDMFHDGIMFDGSSIVGWKMINESDMALFPDPDSAHVDPFFAQKTIGLFCDVYEPATGQPYNRDPRMTARRAESCIASLGIGDAVYFGAEPEFFVFDDVRFTSEPHQTGFAIDSSEFPHNTGTEYDSGNMGHRPRVKGGYFPVPPVDSGQDFRSEMLSVLKTMGVDVEKHHHEVGAAQHELSIRFSSLTKHADFCQLYKYCVHQVAHSYGKTATFMPKPVFRDNGSGMHCHQSIWKGGKPIFAGTHYADLSQTCLYYIGGILKHARAINAFTNPSTNSYKRLVPGYEAPVLLAYSARNRSASCRIPYSPSASGKRVEVRFPDPSANPYLAFAALLMAGIDGIQNRIHPGDPIDKDLYDLPKQERTSIPTVASSLRDALENLDQDRDFLKVGNVMDDDQIDAYIALKMDDVKRFEETPHPIEFDLYYSV